MSSVTSSVSGVSTTYVVTDGLSNTVTVVANSNTGAVSFTSSANGLRHDGMIVLNTLVTMLTSGIIPNAQVGQTASFSN
jgi:hypothetical protein